MKRVWKRMAGMLLTAVLLVNMGMTVSAGEISFSDLSPYLQGLYKQYTSPGYELEVFQSMLEDYIESGSNYWGYFGAGDADKVPQEDARICLAYIISCHGDNSSAEEEKDTKTETEKIQDKAVREIDRALQAGSSTAVFDGRYYGINTLSRDLMREINRRGVNMVFKYTYNEYHYEITIPAGQAPVNENVPWCGPMYLYSLFADTAVVTPVV